MKDRKICKKRFSFYDIWTLKVFDGAKMTEIKEVIEVLESENYKVEIPFYAFLLEKRIERMKLLGDPVKRTEYFLKKYWKKLPDFVVYVILCIFFKFIIIFLFSFWKRLFLYTLIGFTYVFSIN